MKINSTEILQYFQDERTKAITKGGEYPKQLLDKKLLHVTEYRPGVTYTISTKGNNPVIAQ